MVKSKKMSKSAIAVIILALLLVLSMVLGLTGAWFSSNKNSEGASLTFGEITVSLDEDEHMFELTQTVASDFLMPGDTIEGSFTVSSVKEACFVRYVYVLELDVALAGADATAIDGAFESAGYTVVTSGKKWEMRASDNQTYNASTNKYPMLALSSGRAAKQTTAALGGDITIPTSISDNAEGKVLSISLSVYAVQQDNYQASAWHDSFPSVYPAA